MATRVRIRKRLQRVFALVLALSLAAGLMSGMAFAVESEEENEILLTVVLPEAEPEEAAEEESSTPYWTEETEVDGTTQTVTHAVLDSNGNPVDIGAEPPALDTENLEEGNMTAQKFGAFEDEEDAENGIVKLTFDVAGKPVEVETPVDMLIVGDESGSMNMYGRADTASGSTSYMPCLNEEHYYKVDDLQKSLYEGDNAKVDSELKGMSKDLVKQINEAMQKDAAPSEGETDAPSAVEAIRSAKSQKVADAQTASSAADESANAAKAALDAAQAAYDAATEEKKAELEAALKTAQSTYDGAAKAAEKAKTALTSAEKDLAAADKVISLLQKKAENAEKIANCESSTFYLNPHEYGLENIVFKQWADGENADVVIDLVEKAGYVIPEGMTAAEVLARLFPDKTNPLDKNHYYYDSETGTYVEIPYVTNNTIIEEDNGKLYSYWSPEYDNKTGCLDRMMLEKLAAAGLAESILENENSSVGYIGFTKYAYPSLGSGSFMTADQINELLEIIEKTEGHDYTNYVHALWTAKKYIEERENSNNPVYVVFISDGVPTKFDTGEGNKWNVLDTPTEGDDGDCLGYNEIMYGETSYSQVTAAMHVADELKKWYKDTYGVDMEMYTVGINTNDSANELLSSMASSEDHFLYCDDPTELSKTLIDNIDPNEVCPSGVLTDVIGEDFELYVDDEHLFTISGQTYDISAIEAVLNSTEENAKLGNVVSFQVKLAEGATKATIKDVVSVTWEINGVDENGDQISYYVQLKSEELEKFEAGTTRLYDTNADTATTAGANLVYYELTTNEEGTEYFVAKDPTTVEMWTPQVQIVNLGSSDNTIPNNPPQEEIKEENTPKENAPEETITEEDVPLVDIFEEEVPLADVPHTGDNSVYFVIVSVLAVMGLAALTLTKKREAI